MVVRGTYWVLAELLQEEESFLPKHSTDFSFGFCLGKAIGNLHQNLRREDDHRANSACTPNPLFSRGTAPLQSPNLIHRLRESQQQVMTTYLAEESPISG